MYTTIGNGVEFVFLKTILLVRWGFQNKCGAIIREFVYKARPRWRGKCQTADMMPDEVSCFL